MRPTPAHRKSLSRRPAPWAAPALAFLALAVPPQLAFAETPGAVLPPGQEAAVQAMLGSGAAVGGCQAQDAQIERDVIRASYQCAQPSGAAVVVKTTWRHAAKAQSGDAIGGAWALNLEPMHPALRDALLDRASAQGAKVLWQLPSSAAKAAELPAAATADQAKADQVKAGQVQGVQGPAGQGEAAAMRRPMSPEAQRVYDQTHQLIQAGKADACVDLLLPILRKEPHPLLLGRLVVVAAGVASLNDGPSRVDKLVAQADAHPEDSLAQFLGGVAVHYRGHLRAASALEKRADYTAALRLLQRVAKVYPDSPRLWIYTAISHLRLGQQAQAEEAIELAVRHDDGGDADVYYCRAEVWHRKDPAKALQDIARYQQIMVQNKQKGAFLNPNKEQRVERMRQAIAAAQAEQHPLTGEDLFDPILGAPPQEDKPVWPKLVAAAAALVLAVRLWLRRRNSTASR